MSQVPQSILEAAKSQLLRTLSQKEVQQSQLEESVKAYNKKRLEFDNVQAYVDTQREKSQKIKTEYEEISQFLRDNGEGDWLESCESRWK